LHAEGQEFDSPYLHYLKIARSKTMKLSKETLKRIIKEELSAMLREENPSSGEMQAKEFSNKIANELAAGLDFEPQPSYNWDATDYGDLIELSATLPVGDITISVTNDGTPMVGADVSLADVKQDGVSPGSPELKQLVAAVRNNMAR
jgi:hypothetical protein